MPPELCIERIGFSNTAWYQPQPWRSEQRKAAAAMAQRLRRRYHCSRVRPMARRLLGLPVAPAIQPRWVKETASTPLGRQAPQIFAEQQKDRFVQLLQTSCQQNGRKICSVGYTKETETLPSLISLDCEHRQTVVVLQTQMWTPYSNSRILNQLIIGSTEISARVWV